MYDTQEITEVLNFLATQTENIIEREIQGNDKFLVTTLVVTQLEDGLANVEVLAQTANTKQEMLDIITGWGYEIDTVTADQVQIYDLDQFRNRE